MFKVRLVAKGDNQVEGVDLLDVFSLVVKHMSVSVSVALVALYNLDLKNKSLSISKFKNGLGLVNILQRSSSGRDGAWRRRYDDIVTTQMGTLRRGNVFPI
ncbi:hypothetical protein J1N35_040124 [Gossypium stocksii]|uniref:Uncharacterized protein n=1 Tax=Gossypium stocksii TaxID=47602 RepID=A0A9D3ZI13_9ROSI|nr:hypothetical protein J1N35_040124 [Gossypium stocksii]